MKRLALLVVLFLLPTIVFGQHGRGGTSNPTDPRHFDSWLAAKMLSGTNVIYVAKNGSDSNTGKSEQSPFLTVAKALTEQETYFAVSGDPGVIYLGPGTWTEDALSASSGVAHTYIVGSGRDATVIAPLTDAASPALQLYVGNNNDAWHIHRLTIDHTGSHVAGHGLEIYDIFTTGGLGYVGPDTKVSSSSSGSSKDFSAVQYSGSLPTIYVDHHCTYDNLDDGTIAEIKTIAFDVVSGNYIVGTTDECSPFGIWQIGGSTWVKAQFRYGAIVDWSAVNDGDVIIFEPAGPDSIGQGAAWGQVRLVMLDKTSFDTAWQWHVYDGGALKKVYTVDAGGTTYGDDSTTRVQLDFDTDDAQGPDGIFGWDCTLDPPNGAFYYACSMILSNGNLRTIYSSVHSNALYSIAWGTNCTAYGSFNLVGGNSSITSNESSRAWGDSCQAIGLYSTADGKDCIASGSYSQARGQETEATAQNATAEGYHTIASGQWAHSEGGYGTEASGAASHAQGQDCESAGNYSHAGGLNSTASGEAGFVHGNNAQQSGTGGGCFGQTCGSHGSWNFCLGGNYVLITNCFASMAGGRYIQNTNDYSFIFGKGTSQFSRKYTVYDETAHFDRLYTFESANDDSHSVLNRGECDARYAGAGVTNDFDAVLTAGGDGAGQNATNFTADVVGRLTLNGTNVALVGHTHTHSDITDFETAVSNNLAVAANTTHRSSDGSDHTFIDQAVTNGASPTFDGANITGVDADTLDTLDSTDFAQLAAENDFTGGTNQFKATDIRGDIFDGGDNDMHFVGRFSFDVEDGITQPFRVYQGANEYIEVCTSNGSESVKIAGTTSNPEAILVTPSNTVFKLVTDTISWADPLPANGIYWITKMNQSNTVTEVSINNTKAGTATVDIIKQAETDAHDTHTDMITGLSASTTYFETNGISLGIDEDYWIGVDVSSVSSCTNLVVSMEIVSQ